ncbi:hypothetical protein [Turicimonas muris]|uniref:hypothetical protein n=1 Tax=Turicimonas muris TaxID=1796652 RepID=UPI002625F005|nr:hypothetical protein [Turicimonas muris]
MTEIDRIPRLKLSDLRKLIQNANLIADAGRKLFNEGRLSEKKEQQLRDLFQKASKCSFELGETSITLQAIADSGTLELEGFVFSWMMEDGRKATQKVWLTSEDSNLDKGRVLYFVCPYGGKNCRKLYFTERSGFVGRAAFTHTYSDRNLSHRDRAQVKLINQMNREEKLLSNAGGKRMFYRGELTKYGRQVINTMHKPSAASQLAEVFGLSRRVGKTARPTKIKPMATPPPREWGLK